MDENGKLRLKKKDRKRVKKQRKLQQREAGYTKDYIDAMREDEDGEMDEVETFLKQAYPSTLGMLQ